MAGKVGAEFFPIAIQQDDLADHFADAILQSETLCFNAHGVAKYLLSRAVRDAGYKVVLTGEGSDEILGGYRTLSPRHASLQHRKARTQARLPSFLMISKGSILSLAGCFCQMEKQDRSIA